MTRYCIKCGQPTQLERPNLLVCTNKHQNFVDSVPAAGAYVIKDGKVLLGIRSSEPNPGGYNVPGGFLEIPESAEEAAVREVKEELGIDIRPLEIIGTYHTTYGEGGHDVLNILMAAEYIGGDVTPGDDMSGGYPKWFSIDNLPKPDELSFPWQVKAQEDLKHGTKGTWLKIMRRIVVNDLMQENYQYACMAPTGKDFHPDFKSDLTPKEMLKLGVFGGKYMTDCTDEFPADWFADAKLCHEFHDAKLNYFDINASQPLSEWRRKGWIYPEDPRGWFQWYCRYYMGRRIPEEDERQIKRWRAMRRHVAQVQNACTSGDASCHRKQRQALLHWAYDSRVL